MTPYQQFKRALGGRDELLSYEDGDVFGEVYVLNSEEYELCDLVRVVYLCGVAIAVPIAEKDLDAWEAEHVHSTAHEIAERTRDAIAEDAGYDG